MFRDICVNVHCPNMGTVSHRDICILLLVVQKTQCSFEIIIFQCAIKQHRKVGFSTENTELYTRTTEGESDPWLTAALSSSTVIRQPHIFITVVHLWWFLCWDNVSHSFKMLLAMSTCILVSMKILRIRGANQLLECRYFWAGTVALGCCIFLHHRWWSSRVPT